MENVNSSLKASLLDDKLNFYLEAVAKFCDKCGASYSTKDLQLVLDSSMTAIIHFSCSKCKSRHIATFLKPVGVSSRSPINTDLNVEEIGKFSTKDGITNDDILKAYIALKRKNN